MKLTLKFPVAVFTLALIVASIVSCSKKSSPPPKASSYLLTTTFAGNGTVNPADTSLIANTFTDPAAVAVDAAGNIYVADSGDNLVRKVTPQGVISTIAGSGTKGFANGTGVVASFNNPLGIAVDASGNIYVADSGNNMIREISPSGVVTTLAGNGTAGTQNGAPAAAEFNNPYGVAIDAAGNVYVGDTGNNQIRKITAGGTVSTLAGNGTVGTSNGAGVGASFNSPEGLALDASGDVYVADAGNHLIREVLPSGMVSTYAGSGVQGSANGSLTAASFYTPNGLTFDAAGNMYITDGGSSEIREISAAGIVTTIAGNGTAGFTNGIGTGAIFNQPSGIAIDQSYNAYVADYGNNVIRKIILKK
jgi:sugar lactone lactonase YvrE